MSQLDSWDSRHSRQKTLPHPLLHVANTGGKHGRLGIPSSQLKIHSRTMRQVASLQHGKGISMESITSLREGREGGLTTSSSTGGLTTCVKQLASVRVHRIIPRTRVASSSTMSFSPPISLDIVFSGMLRIYVLCFSYTLRTRRCSLCMSFEIFRCASCTCFEIFSFP